MLNVVVCVSGGGTNLQAIIDGIARGTITNVRLARVISNNRNAYALERAAGAGIDAVCVSPRDYGSREQFHEALLRAVDEAGALPPTGWNTGSSWATAGSLIPTSKSRLSAEISTGLP